MSDFNLEEAMNGPVIESDESVDENDQENEEIIVKHTKKSEVPEKKQLPLGDEYGTVFQFSTEVNNDKLVLKLNEIGAFSPFIYLKKMTLDEFKENHKMFKSCDNLEKVQEHIEKLFNEKKIELSQVKNSSICLNITAHNISKEEKIPFNCKRKMTTQKDEILIELYKIQKNEIKILKDMENFIKKNEKNGNVANEIINKMKEIMIK